MACQETVPLTWTTCKRFRRGEWGHLLPRYLTIKWSKFARRSCSPLVLATRHLTLYEGSGCVPGCGCTMRGRKTSHRTPSTMSTWKKLGMGTPRLQRDGIQRADAVCGQL